MDRLVFVVAHRGVIDVGDFVESELAVETQIRVTLFELVAAIAVVLKASSSLRDRRRFDRDRKVPTRGRR
jgi:hypothetical protein